MRVIGLILGREILTGDGGKSRAKRNQSIYVPYSSVRTALRTAVLSGSSSSEDDTELEAIVDEIIG